MIVKGFCLVEFCCVQLNEIHPLPTIFFASLCHQCATNSHDFHHIIRLFHLPDEIFHPIQLSANNVCVSDQLQTAMQLKYILPGTFEGQNRCFVIIVPAKIPSHFNSTIPLSTQKPESKIKYHPVEKTFLACAKVGQQCSPLLLKFSFWQLFWKILPFCHIHLQHDLAFTATQ